MTPVLEAGAADPADIEIVPGSPLLEAEVDGEIVGLSLEQDVSFGFNRTGSYIWSQLQQPIRLSVLLDRIEARFDVPRDQCAAELREFLSTLAEDGLVTIRVGSGG